MDTFFLIFLNQKCYLEELKLGLRSVKVKRCQKRKLTARKKGKKMANGSGGGSESDGRGAPVDPAYLPLQHQLFGEQHGLVAERLRHLHSSRRVPGTAWTFDTCGRQGRKGGVSAAAANQDSRGMEGGIHGHLRVFVQDQKGQSQSCYPEHFTKATSPGCS